VYRRPLERPSWRLLGQSVSGSVLFDPRSSRMVQSSFQGGHIPDRQIRNLTPAPRRWKVVGLEMADRCTFCGAPSEATVGCPDETAPLIFQVGVSALLNGRSDGPLREVKTERTARLAMDMATASDAIVTERRKFHAERNRRRQVAHYQLLTNAPRRQESAAEHELERQRRFGETVEQTKARLQADLEAWERTSAQRLADTELKIRERFGLLEDTELDDVTQRGSPLL
jgi:hypothetical protein